MRINLKLDNILEAKNVDSKYFCILFDSQLYVTANHSHILFVLILCARFQSNPKESHLVVVKRILIYFKGTINIALWYLKIDSFGSCRLH